MLENHTLLFLRLIPLFIYSDLATSEILLRAEFEDYEDAGFHAQQAAEKFIKAFLVRHQIPFPKSHNIAVLRQLVARVDAQLADRLAAADALTPYGVEFRYPGDLPSVSRDEGGIALGRGSARADCGVLEALS